MVYLKKGVKSMIDANLIEKLSIVTSEEQTILDGKKSIDKKIYMENYENIVSSKKILSSGKQIAIRPHTRFIGFPKHSHDYVEIVFVCKGSVTHIIDQEIIELHEGELLFLCQNVFHEILPSDVDDIAVNFIVRPEFFDKVIQMMGEEDTPLRRFILENLKSKNASAGYLLYKVSKVVPVQNLIENLIYILLNDTHNKRNVTQLTMGLLFLNLISFTDKLVSKNVEEQNIVKILGYIENNYKDGSLSELSKIVHYDISSLSREIKKRTGKKYTDLVSEKRLSQACFMLKNTDMTIEEIANSVGYNNTSFFYRIFKDKYGCSPKQYKLQ